jgi:ferritin-like metal-binding protein YciE
MENVQDLFEHELRDIYDAEQKLVRATATMSKKVTDSKFSTALAQHSKETEGQVKRLEKVFQELGKKPRREACDGINGLISEFSGFVKDEKPAPEVLDCFAHGAAAKVEQYEIEAYKGLIELGNRLGLSTVKELKANLAEEEAAAQKLESMSEALTNRVPVGA